MNLASADNPEEALAASLRAVRECTICAAHLPLPPKPILQASPSARLLIASQAPGTKAHQSGVPFSDLSGARLREWMGISNDDFYDPMQVAIIPMAFCYPGKGASGDAPPRRECARTWRPGLLQQLPSLELTLLVGTYAQNDVLGPGRITERVRGFRDYLPTFFPLPHPSWRSTFWMKKNPWFESETLPALRQEVRRVLQGQTSR